MALALRTTYRSCRFAGLSLGSMNAGSVMCKDPAVVAGAQVCCDLILAQH